MTTTKTMMTKHDREAEPISWMESGDTPEPDGCSES